MDKNICLNCEFHKVKKAHGGWDYVACSHKPYIEAWVKQIDCPKNHKRKELKQTNE